jgi:hypothetical protein
MERLEPYVSVSAWEMSAEGDGDVLCLYCMLPDVVEEGTEVEDAI